MADCSVNRFFSPVQTHIKLYQGSFVAVEGPNMTHKMSSLPSMQFPYQQVMTARITLRAGQTNYLLNHLGLGDNATFLSITAQYDSKSKFESDNYLNYSYYSNKGKLFSFSQMLVLTGNSENRIEQLFLHNPNQNSAVIIEVMVGVIDETYNFFSENDELSNNAPISFPNLKHTDVSLWDSDETILVVKNSFNQPILYLNLKDINALTQDGKILTIDETSVGNLLLIFQSEYDATQSRVKITQWVDDVINNGNVNTPIDDFEPIINFTSNITDDDTLLPYGSNLTSVDGNRSFVGGSVLNLSDYSNIITKSVLSSYIISSVIDFENSQISITPLSDLIISTDNGTVINDIQAIGSYYVTFDITDSFGNKVLSSVNVKINIEI